MDDLHALNDFAKNHVFSIQPRSQHGGDEKLRPIGVWPGVGHGQKTNLVVLEFEVLVGEFVAVDGFAACAVVVREVSTLKHEIGNHAVEDAALVVTSFVTYAEGAEVLSGFGHDVREQLENNATCGFVRDGDVEIDLGVCHGFISPMKFARCELRQDTATSGKMNVGCEATSGFGLLLKLVGWFHLGSSLRCHRRQTRQKARRARPRSGPAQPRIATRSR